MNRFNTSQLLFCALALCAAVLLSPLAASAAPITISTVPVGNVGNADHGISEFDSFGGVDYFYHIGKTEVTNAQYAALLNEKAQSDPLELYNPNMGSDARGGITRSGAGTIPDPYVYSTKTNMGNKPVNYVSWYDASRFANWLHNGQGAGDTETGAYTLLGGTPTPSNGLSITRNPGATWFLPSEDEWFKAAYHQPAAQGGNEFNYWHFPTRTHLTPTRAAADAAGNISNPGPNVANYDYGADWNAQDGNLTTVGSAGPLSESYYGTADQGGNVLEWNETLIGGSSRGARGGSWNLDAIDMFAPIRFAPTPTAEGDALGFRVAAAPEPNTLLLGALSVIGLLRWRRRLRLEAHQASLP
jgi:formylglycine-generating enzyme